MHYTKKDIAKLDRIERLKIINAISGVKSANLIGSISDTGITNLGIFNSVFHLGSNPPLQGFVMRPIGEVPRHTYENISQSGIYTINHVNSSIIKRAHYTSAKFDASISEFKTCGLTEEYLPGFEAPFVKESHIKMGMRFQQAIPIPLNDTLMIIGEIECLFVPKVAFGQDDDLDLEAIDTVGISGLNTYYGLKKLARFPYARVSEVPDFISGE